MPDHTKHPLAVAISFIDAINHGDVDRLATLMDKDYSLVIEGHTDTKGSNTKNLTLSQSRADSVLSHLAGVRLGSGLVLVLELFPPAWWIFCAVVVYALVIPSCQNRGPPKNCWRGGRAGAAHSDIRCRRGDGGVPFEPGRRHFRRRRSRARPLAGRATGGDADRRRLRRQIGAGARRAQDSCGDGERFCRTSGNAGPAMNQQRGQAWAGALAAAVLALDDKALAKRLAALRKTQTASVAKRPK